MDSQFPDSGSEPANRPGKKRRQLWRIPVGFLAVVVLLLSGVWTFRRQIVLRILDQVNQTIPGTILIDDGRARWSMVFTRLSLRLEHVVLLDEDGSEVIRADRVEAIVNPLHLLQRRIDVSRLVLTGASVELVTDRTGILNLYHALGITRESREERKAQKENRPKSEQKWRHWNAAVDNVELKDCGLAIKRPDGWGSVRLDYLELMLKRKDTDGAVNLKTGLSLLRSEGLGPGILQSKDYVLDVDIDVVEGVAILRRGDLDVNSARIAVGGTLELYPPFTSDLSMVAVGADTELLLTFLPPWVSFGNVEPHGNGEITINGSLSGPLADHPWIYLQTTCRDFALRHKVTGLSMDRIGFSLGIVQEEGPMVFELKDLEARLPDGEINADILLEHLKQPRLEAQIHAGVNLDTLADFFVFPGSESISGRLDLDVDVIGFFDENGTPVASQQEEGEIRLLDFRYLLPGSEAGIRNLDLLFRLNKGLIEIQSLDAQTDIGDITLNGSVGNVWPLLLGGDGPLKFTLGLNTPRINPSAMFKDAEVAASWDKNLEELDVAFTFDTTVSELRNTEILPYGRFRVEDMTAYLPSAAKRLNRFSGEVDIGEILDFNLSGKLNESSVNVQASVDGYQGLLDKDLSLPVDVRMRLDSPLMLVRDLLPGESQGTSYSAVLGSRDVEMDLELIFDNSKWFTSLGSWPEGRWILRDFSGVSVYREDAFRMSFDLHSADGKAELRHFTARMGDSDFQAVGLLTNPGALLSDDPRDADIEVKLSSQRLDMADILGVVVPEESDSSSPDPVARPDTSEESVDWKLGQRTYPNMSLDLSIRDFRMYPFHWRNIRGSLGMSPEGLVTLDNLVLSTVLGGTGRFIGAADLSSEDGYSLNADVEIDNLDLASSKIRMTMGTKSVALGDVVKGMLTGEVSLSTTLNEDLSLNLDNSTFDLKARLEGGRLVNFPPFVAMADRFRNQNMEDVRLDDLSLRASLEDGKFSVPRTAVGSTLGYIEVDGYSRLDSYMSYSVTVPNSVIDDLVTGMVFGNLGNEANHEIINAENSGKSRTTLNIVGEPENIIIGLGKRGRPRLEDRWERKNR